MIMSGPPSVAQICAGADGLHIAAKNATADNR
jgi:hypothetical protein